VEQLFVSKIYFITFDIVKSIGIILLATVFSLQSIQINLNDLYKIKDLIEHANYHAEAYGDDWLTFFSKHYGEQKEEHTETHQHEQEDHNKLPNADQLISSTLTFIYQQYRLEISSPISNCENSSFFYQSLYHFQNLVDIFQPPRQ
jgi:hypothetical protein